MADASQRRWLNFPLRALVVALILFACWLGWNWVFGYDPSTFKGEGRITDSGFWSYPRYCAVMPEVSLGKAGDTTIKLENLPSTRMTLSFRLTSGSLRKESSVVLKCKLTDDTGFTVCEIADPLRDWDLATSDFEMSLWHMRSRDLKISSKRRYSLTIGIENPEPDSLSVTVEPRLAGGGNELP